MFLALSDRTRLRILNLLTHGEICVLDFADILNEPQPKISRHLAYLRQNNLVETRRKGKQIFYKIATITNTRLKSLLEAITNEIAYDEVLRRDALQLSQNLICDCANTNVMSQKKNLEIYLL